MTEILDWPDGGVPSRIQYARRAMEQIRRHALEGLAAHPRFGMGVGGLLIGEQVNGAIRLLECVEIPSSHQNGPSFNLTPEEIKPWRQLTQKAGKPRVIGWYCSKPRGPAALNEADLTIYRELCPETWQVSLVVRASGTDPVRGTFFFRNAQGQVLPGAEHSIDEWYGFEDRPKRQDITGVTPAGEADTAQAERRSTLAAVIEMKPASPPLPLITEVVAPAAAKEERAAPQVAVAPAPTPVTAAPVPSAATPVPIVAATLPLAAPPVITMPLPIVPKVEERPVAEPVRERPAKPAKEAAPPAWMSTEPLKPAKGARTKSTVAAAVLLAIGLGAAWMTQDSWMPKPPLTLDSTESKGTLQIHWNKEALRGVDHAPLYINDGGELKTFELNTAQLQSGTMTYQRKSPRVAATLDTGSTRATTTFLESTIEPPTPPQPAPAPPAAQQGTTAPAVAPTTKAAEPATAAVSAPPKAEAPRATTAKKPRPIPDDR